MSSFLSPRGGTPQGGQIPHEDHPHPSVSIGAARKIPHAEPIQGKERGTWFTIEGQAYGPDSVFSKGARLKGPPYLRALAYVIGTCETKGQFDCEPGEHYLSPTEVRIWHRGSKTEHVARNLGPACKRHAGVTHQGPGQGGVRERENQAGAGPGTPQSSSLETAKHDPERDAWERAARGNDLWAELKERGCLTAEWQGKIWYQADDVTQLAVKHTVDKVFGKFSSKTFMTFALEDRFDYLEMAKFSGRWWIRRLDNQ